MGKAGAWAAMLLCIGCAASTNESPAREPEDACGRIVPERLRTYAARIAAVACRENTLWFAPFIDGNGRLASLTVAESERLYLRDGTTPAWRRVADYWKGSGLLGEMETFPGAGDCGHDNGGHLQTASCRAFLTDTPWSAVFVSFVMNRVGVPGFRASASHVDYVRDTYVHPQTSPYVLADPDTTRPAQGDLLCYARMREPLGHEGLRRFLERDAKAGLDMHCDIVVAADAERASRLYLVGGNVLQGVTLRVLPLNRKGLIWGLPHRTNPAPDCRPGNEAGCSFNRQDWVALLKLKKLPVPVGPLLPPGQPVPVRCCTLCPLPMPPDMRRCPPPPRPLEPMPPPANDRH